jgi:UDP-glucose 4-epimerase
VLIEYRAGGVRLAQQRPRAGNARKLVFASSATVYDEPVALPLREDHRLLPFNPYGRTKTIVKELSDLARLSSDLIDAILRYFNAVGAHEGGWIGAGPCQLIARSKSCRLPYPAPALSDR